jgi:hypothetical protein
MTIEAMVQKTIQLASGAQRDPVSIENERRPANSSAAANIAKGRLRLRIKDFEKIWLWLDEERQLLGKDGWGTISLADGIVYIDNWLKSAAVGHLRVIASAMADRGEQAIAAGARTR